ncbi:MAG: hypothetical protein QOE70_6267 [Chthoniobacter sp.]|nr:hypothetical protein [Chthoniobacter sp.]
MKKKAAPAPEAAPLEIPIREIRGQRVLLDSDLAAIYGVPTSALNQAVKRNRLRFPTDFMFQLTREESASLRSKNVLSNAEPSDREGLASNSSQIVMSSRKHRGAAYLPFAFTEHGALQAANILKSERAAAMSVFVIRAFVQMRAVLLGTNALAGKLAELEERLTGRLDTHEHAIVHVMQQLVKLLSPPSLPPRPPKPRIGFKP